MALLNFKATSDLYSRSDLALLAMLNLSTLSIYVLPFFGGGCLPFSLKSPLQKQHDYVQCSSSVGTQHS